MGHVIFDKPLRCSNSGTAREEGDKLERGWNQAMGATDPEILRERMLAPNAALLEACRAALNELRDMHSAEHPGCKDQGPTTCPTWAVIHQLSAAIRAAEGGEK